MGAQGPGQKILAGQRHGAEPRRGRGAGAAWAAVGPSGSAVGSDARASIRGPSCDFIGLPALQRGAIDRPAHLIDAGGPDRPVGLVEGDAARIPGQAAVVEDAPGLGLDILDHRLVLDLQHRARRQHPAPMLHQIEIHPVIAAELRQIIGIVDLIGEMLAEAGQAGVERIAAQMDDPRLGQDEMDEPDEHVVVGHLVGDPGRLGRQRAKPVDIGFAAAAELLPREKGQAFREIQGLAGLHAGGELAHEAELAGAMDRGMAGQDLLHQSGARARESEDEDRQLGRRRHGRSSPRGARA